MHEWHSYDSPNILKIEEEFSDFYYNTDYCEQSCKVDGVSFERHKVFNNIEEARTWCCRQSYACDYAIAVKVVTKKLSKSFENAEAKCWEKRKELKDFEEEFSAAYGRKSQRTTCPKCKSSITTSFLKHTTSCPVCGSYEIISEANWKKLRSKEEAYRKAAEKYAEQCVKCGVTWVCGFEWHC